MRTDFLVFLIKSGISGLLIGLVATISKRYPALGAMVASLPLISVLGMIWLWCEKPDRELMAVHAGATFWYVIPSLPMFLFIPFLLRYTPWGFWEILFSGCVLTVALYGLTIFLR